jgi:hypothetical protein
MALWNEYDLLESEYSRALAFSVVGEDFAGTCPLTPAAHSYLMQAVQEWCEVANRHREEDVAIAMPRLIVAKMEVD